MNFQQAQGWVDSFGYRGMDFNLGRFAAVLDKFNRPQASLPSVHIAGTNGKGSVGSMIESGLLANGVSAGFYSSPHLVSILERFRINGRYITPGEFARLASFCRKKLGRSGKLTQFELLTLMAFLWFQENKTPMAVFETGLGGRLDATNVLEDVRVSVITSVGLDHQAWLGKSLSKIAGEKAGIIKTGAPLVAVADPRTEKILKERARAKRAPVFFVPRVSSAGPRPRFLIGAHQRLNARVAEKALAVLGETWKKLNKEKARHGIESAKWPARFEKVVLNGRSVFIDGAHNPQAAEALAGAWKSEKLGKANIIFSSLKDKDAPSMIRFLGPLAGKAAIVPLAHERARPWGKKGELKPWKGKAFFSENWRMALEKFLKEDRPVLITGSLIFAGEVKKGLGLDPTKKLKYHGPYRNKGVNKFHAASRN